MYVQAPVARWWGLGAGAAPIIAGASSTGASIVGSSGSNLPLSTKIEGGIASGLFTAAALTPPPANVALAIAGAVATLLATFGVGSGCGETCVLSTKYANDAEKLLQQNHDAYFAHPAPRDPSLQKFHLMAFDTIWNDLVQQCSNPSLGNAGKRCISDRQRGACVWKSNGQCWNWFLGYRDNIASDPDVAQPSVTSAVGNLLQSAGVSSNLAAPLLIGGLLLIGVLVVMK